MRAPHKRAPAVVSAAYSAAMHIGLVAPELPSHLDTAISVGLGLLRRGHRVTYFGFGHAERRLRESGLRFVPLAYLHHMSEAAPGQATDNTRESVRPDALREFSLRECTALRLRSLPELLRREQVDGLVADQASLEAS